MSYIKSFEIELRQRLFEFWRISVNPNKRDYKMLVKLKVHPDSKHSSIIKKAEDAYEVWVTAPAERGLANKAASQPLAKALKQNPGRFHIIKGAAFQNKIVKVLS